MNKLKLAITTLLILMSLVTFSKDVLLKGVVTEKHNDGFRMVGVQVEVINPITQEAIKSLKTNHLGEFQMTLPQVEKLQLRLDRKNFLPFTKDIQPKILARNGEVTINVKMERKPGYVFDVTLKDGNVINKKDGTAFLNVVKGARIEIYNNTQRKSELVLTDHPSELFEFVFESGNYYTLMIRKKGFFNKRIEAYIDVEGCILCFDGLDINGPELIGETTTDNVRGTFLADIVLQPIKINQTIEIENIFYDFDQSKIRPDAAKELDKLTTILRDNQHVTLELGSHTDARGSDDYNLKLSDARAKSAVKYLTAKRGISENRMIWKGYGESQLVNNCNNEKECSEQEHQKNRRTTLKIIGLDDDPLEKKSLKEIIESGQKQQLISQSK